MNNLYLVLPIVDDVFSDEESCCLKTLDSSAAGDYFVDLIRCLYKVLAWGQKYEEFNVYRDRARFKELYKQSEDKGQRPVILPLLTELPELKDMPDSMHVIKINNVTLQKGILCSYINNANSNTDVMIDHGGLLCDLRQLNINNASGKKVDCIVIKCERAEIYKWFVDNRNPPRKYDPEYDKHNGHVHIAKGGEPVSKCTYNVSDCQNMLKRAIGSNAHKRKYFMDCDRNRLILFMDEGFNPPTFHCFDVDIDDPEEIAKMQKDCGKDIIEQLKGIFDLWKQKS